MIQFDRQNSVARYYNHPTKAGTEEAPITTANRKCLRLYSISYDTLLKHFTGQVVIGLDVPEDAVVFEVSRDFETRSWVLCVWHETFDAVAEGEMLLRFPCKVWDVEVKP